MKKEIKVPSVGESIQEATIAKWHKKTGDYVETNQELLTLETDKAGVEIVSEFSGVLTIKVEEGKVVQIGTLIGEIDTDAAKPAARPPAAGASASNGSAKPTPPPPPSGASASSAGGGLQSVEGTLSPAVRRIVSEKGLDPSAVQGTGKDGRLTKQDVMTAQPGGAQSAPSAKPVEKPTPLPVPGMTTRTGGTRRVPMTTIRKRIAERLVQAQHTAAILTTFNEIDMSALLSLREKYKEKFKERYGVNLGMMGFFAKAAIEALKAFPQVNAFIDGTDIVYNDFFNVGVAVGTEKGLIVPVIRDADQLSLAEIELTIRHFAQKARDGKISIDDLRDGTFTISNGGVYGSLMSTPILNPPQSGILGMHKVEDRAVVVNKEIVIRPMMYVALSYDHRMIDGSEAVSFLVKIKENIEDPQRLLLEV